MTVNSTLPSAATPDADASAVQGGYLVCSNYPAFDLDAARAELKAALESNPTELLPEGLGDHLHVVAYAMEDPQGEAELVAVLADGSGGADAPVVYYALEGGCDYTGWDCQSGLDVSRHAHVRDAVCDGITRAGRAMLDRAGYSFVPAVGLPSQVAA